MDYGIVTWQRSYSRAIVERGYVTNCSNTLISFSSFLNKRIEANINVESDILFCPTILPQKHKSIMVTCLLGIALTFMERKPWNLCSLGNSFFSCRDFHLPSSCRICAVKKQNPVLLQGATRSFRSRPTCWAEQVEVGTYETSSGEEFSFLVQVDSTFVT